VCHSFAVRYTLGLIGQFLLAMGATRAALHALPQKWAAIENS